MGRFSTTSNPRTPSSAVIVYLHGGGYISTAVSAHAWLVDHLARRTGADVVMPLYPLTPHHTWSEAHRLVLDLYRRTVAENPGKRIILMGDSAGGGLAAVISLSLAEAGEAQPDELALISPWVDITNTNPDIADYVDAVVTAAAGRTDVVVVGQSLGGFTAPLAAQRLGARGLVLVNAMVPRPGEQLGDWWAATGFEAAIGAAAERDGRDLAADPDQRETMFHDVPADVVAAAFSRPLHRSDVVGAYAGLRPLLDLPDAEGSDETADISRRHAVLTSSTGVVTIVGGKLTTYRHIALDALERLAPTLGLGKLDRRPVPLPGATDAGNVAARLGRAWPLEQPVAAHLAHF